MPAPTPWPPLSEYIVPSDTLGYEFAYPKEYLESIEWDNQDIDAGGDGHALGFLQRREALRDLSFVHKATSKRLVPFARGDNRDSLFCFEAADSSNVYVINLGEKPMRARLCSSSGYVHFLNEYRANLDLASWKPAV